MTARPSAAAMAVARQITAIDFPIVTPAHQALAERRYAETAELLDRLARKSGISVAHMAEIMEIEVPETEPVAESA